MHKPKMRNIPNACGVRQIYENNSMELSTDIWIYPWTASSESISPQPKMGSVKIQSTL